MHELIVVNRFRVDPSDLSAEHVFATDARTAMAALAARPGYVEGRIGRNLDDPGLWVLTSTWVNVGSYRRALSSYDVKVGAVPLLSSAIDEPSAYESVGDDDGEELNRPVPRVLD